MSQFHNVHLNDDSDEYSKSSNIPSFQFQHEKSNISPNKKDVYIQIRDQETTTDNYINYIIEINIKSDNHSWFDKVKEKNWNVLRRYSEFDLLRLNLTKLYPACVIPPLPSKIVSFNPWNVTNQRKDSEFIDSRRQRLEMFLNRLLMHPKLREELLIFNFLQKNDNWSDLTMKKDLSETVGSFVNWRWTNVQSHLIHLFDNNVNMSYLNELVRSNSLSEDAIKLIDRGKQVQDSTKRLLNCLTKVEEQISLLHHLYKNYGEAFFDWCNLDPSMGDTLQSFGHICDTFSSLAESPGTSDRPMVFSQPGKNNTPLIFTVLSWSEMNLLLQELYEFGESWIELGGRLAYLHKKINRQSTQTDTKTEQLERLKLGQPFKSGGFSSLTNKFRKSLSESEICDLRSNIESTLITETQYLESLKTDKVLFDDCIAEEIEHFEAIRSRDMHVILLSYACNQLAHSERCLRLWQRAKQTLE